MLFKDAAKRFLDLHLNEWKNAKHRQQWQNSLKTYAYPTLGNRPIAAIDGAVITDALSADMDEEARDRTAGKAADRASHSMGA